MTLITGVAVVVGLLLFVLLVVRPGSSPSVPTSSDNPAGLVKASMPVPSGLADGRSVGKADAPVKMDIWADFQCPYCSQFARNVEPQVITDFVAKGIVRMTVHDFTFIGSGHDPDESVDAAVAARCADRQGRFWDFYETVFSNQGTTENSGAFTRDRLLAMADLLGLDHASFLACLSDQSVRADVVTETAAGTKAGVSSTPTSFINGKPVVGLKDYATIAALLTAAAPSGSPASGGASGSPAGSPSPSGGSAAP